MIFHFLKVIYFLNSCSRPYHIHLNIEHFCMISHILLPVHKKISEINSIMDLQMGWVKNKWGLGWKRKVKHDLWSFRSALGVPIQTSKQPKMCHQKHISSFTLTSSRTELNRDFSETLSAVEGNGRLANWTCASALLCPESSLNMNSKGLCNPLQDKDKERRDDSNSVLGSRSRIMIIALDPGKFNSSSLIYTAEPTESSATGNNGYLWKWSWRWT